MKTILAADIGGTNSRFAAFQVDTDHKLSLVATKWLKTRDAGSFYQLIDLLKESDFPMSLQQATTAVFAVAGPVENEIYCKPPNIPWEIDGSRLDRDFGIKRSILINDFTAQAFACRSPIIETAQQVVSGRIDPSKSLAVIGAGTGLGHAVLLPLQNGGYVALSSEGGHATCPFESEAEFDFMAFLVRQTGEPYVRAETVVTGGGLSLIHQYLTGKKLEPAQVAAVMADDSQTLKWAARFYGRVARNFALQVLAYGGVYIAGGVAAKIPRLVTHAEFESAFRSTATMAHVIDEIPVFLNTNEESGLWGAALRGVQMIRDD
jgi:glucokinase